MWLCQLGLQELPTELLQLPFPWGTLRRPGYLSEDVFWGQGHPFKAWPLEPTYKWIYDRGSITLLGSESHSGLIRKWGFDSFYSNIGLWAQAEIAYHLQRALLGYGQIGSPTEQPVCHYQRIQGVLVLSLKNHFNYMDLSEMLAHGSGHYEVFWHF